MSCLSGQVDAYKEAQAQQAARKAELAARVQQATEAIKKHGHQHMVRAAPRPTAAAQA